MRLQKAASRRGVTMIEYALMLALLVIVLVTALPPVRQQLGRIFDSLSAAFGG